VLTGLDDLPASLNAWRSLLEWLGGFGILVFAVAVLPVLGVGGSQLNLAVTPGPMKAHGLSRRIRAAARGLVWVYFALSLACCLALRAAGMGWFDAFCHAGTVLALGGFSTHDANFGYFHSPAVECVAVAFMVLSALNFSTHYLAWRTRSLRAYLHDPQTYWCLGLLASGVGVVTAYLYATSFYSDFLQALRYALFNTVSLATSGGFHTTDYGAWPAFAPYLLLLMCAVVSCSGSTGGGIQLVRGLLLLKQARRELVRIVHPRVVNPVRYGGETLANQVMFSVLAFMLIYGGLIVLFTLALLAMGSDPVTAFTAVIACINNTGPGLGGVGPATTYAGLNDVQHWILIAAMIMGRLELLTVLVLFTPAFWRP